MSKAKKKLAKQEAQRIAAIAKFAGIPLSAADRAAKIAANQYSYQRGPAKAVEVRTNADGTRTHRMPPSGTYMAKVVDVTIKPNGAPIIHMGNFAPLASPPTFDAFAKLDDVLANISKNAASIVAKKYDAPKLKASEQPEQNPDSFEHVALIDCYVCQCGHKTKLLTGFARIVPGSFYQDGEQRILPVTYRPDSVTPQHSSISTESCVECVLLPRTLPLSGPPSFVRPDREGDN